MVDLYTLYLISQYTGCVRRIFFAALFILTINKIYDIVR
nr:MAG TPA: hypothetical protein [Caudoviricetes sp.]